MASLYADLLINLSFILKETPKVVKMISTSIRVVGDDSFETVNWTLITKTVHNMIT